MKRIYIGSDHVAINLKKAVVEHLQEKNMEVVDVGAYSADVVADYQDYAQKVACAVAAGEGDGGIVICGTGLGVSMAANKVAGVRAALCHDVYTAHQARAHNDANVLAMGTWVVSPQRMPCIVDEWLNTPFEGGRHTARLNSLDRYMNQPKHELQTTFDANELNYAMALSIRQTVFGPVLFSDRLEEGFAVLQRAGFCHVELSVRNADDLPYEELKTMLDRHGLSVSALATGQGCLHDRLCLTAIDPQTAAASLKRLETIIDLAEKLQCDVILGGVRGRLSGSLSQQAQQRETFLKSTRRLAAHAAEKGVTLLIEPINRYETNLINNAEEALAFIDECACPNIKVLLDTFHMNIEEVDLAGSIRLTGSRLGYVHLVDSNRLSPGQGHIDFIEVMTALQRSGFAGTVSAEILPLPDDESAVIRTANFLEHIGVHMQTKENTEHPNEL